jgi:hypothetical protein
MEQPRPLINNIEERLIVARHVQEIICRNGARFPESVRSAAGLHDPANFQLTLAQLSVFLYMDIDELQDLPIFLEGRALETTADLHEGLTATEPFLGICKSGRCPSPSGQFSDPSLRI